MVITCGTATIIGIGHPPRSSPATRHTKHLAKTQTGLADGPLLHFGAGLVAGIVGTSVTAPAARLM